MVKKEPSLNVSHSDIATVAKEHSKYSPSNNVTIEIEDNQDIKPQSDSILPESKNQSNILPYQHEQDGYNLLYILGYL